MSQTPSRRDLFRHGGVIAVGLVAPPWLSTIARADILRTAKGMPSGPGNVLVVLQLSGGNDGLNTLVPWSDPLYGKLRPTIGIAAEKVLRIDDRIGLHPALGGLHALYKEGKVAFVQGVGYPNPNRSHFKSMEIWQSASPKGDLKYGWIGRHFDGLVAGPAMSPVAGIGLSVEKPRSLNAKDASIPCFASLADIQNMVGDPDAERRLREIQGATAGEGDPTRAVQLANSAALDAMTELKSRLAEHQPKQVYGTDAFGAGLQQIAQIVMCSPNTRVVYFSVGGFDTHSRQSDQHEKLMKGLGDSVLAFQREMEAAGAADRVTLMAFSEFGRRSHENGSVGTDHGQAGPMILVGGRVKGGLYGPLPNLADLDDGDLKWGVDFRQVYATALEDWVGGDAKVVLGTEYASLGLFR